MTKVRPWPLGEAVGVTAAMDIGGVPLAPAGMVRAPRTAIPAMRPEPAFSNERRGNMAIPPVLFVASPTMGEVGVVLAGAACQPRDRTGLRVPMAQRLPCA